MLSFLVVVLNHLYNEEMLVLQVLIVILFLVLFTLRIVDFFIFIYFSLNLLKESIGFLMSYSYLRTYLELMSLDSYFEDN